MKKLTTKQARKIALDSLKEIEESRQKKVNEEAEFIKYLEKEDIQETKDILDKHIKKYSNVWESLAKI